MTASHIIAIQQEKALTEAAEILARLDPEVSERVAKANHDRGVPTSPKRPLETVTYLAECVASLAKIVDEQLTPKKRGRPRKAS